MDKAKFNDLEDRLIRFAITNIKTAEKINNSYVGNHLKNQLIRSGTSPALNYAEAQYSESKKDFIHKIRVVLKELSETRVCLKLIMKSGIYQGKLNLDKILKESSELIAIFITSINTARKRKPTNNQ